MSDPTTDVSDQATGVGSPPTVLVADGDDDRVLLCRTFLEQEGYRVLTAGSVEEVEALLGAAVPDAVLLSGALAANSGWSLLTTLTDGRLPGQVPVVVLAEPGSGDENLEAWRRGAAEVVAEPPGPLVLTRVLRDVLDTSPEQRRALREASDGLLPGTGRAGR